MKVPIVFFVFLLQVQPIVGQKEYGVVDTSSTEEYLQEAKEIDKENQFEQFLEAASIQIDSSNFEAAKTTLNMVKEIQGRLPQNEFAVSYHHKYGVVLKKTGDPETAIVHLEKAIEIGKFFFGRLHPKVVEMLHDLGKAWRALQQYDKVEEIFFEALHICQNNPEMPFELTGNTLNNLGYNYDQRGDDKAAESFYLKAIEFYKDHPIHQFSAYPQMQLGTFYFKRNSYGKARSCFQRAVEIREKIELGTVGLANSYHHLGASNARLGNLELLQVYQLKALEIFRDVLGTNDLKVAGGYSNLAYVAWASKTNAFKGVQYARKAIAIYKQNGREYSKSCALAYNHLANCYDILNEDDKTLSCHLKTLSIRNRVLGKFHIDVVASLANIGNQYNSKKNYSKAIHYYQNALESFEGTGLDEHEYLALIHTNLGNTYLSIERYEEALSHLQKGAEVFSTPTLRNHYQAYGPYRYLGRYYLKVKDYDRAKKNYGIAIEKVKKLSRGTAGFLSFLYQKMSEVYLATDDFSMAAQYVDSTFVALNYDKQIGDIENVQDKIELLSGLNAEAELLEKKYRKSGDQQLLVDLDKNLQLTIELIDLLAASLSNSNARSTLLKNNYPIYERMIWAGQKMGMTGDEGSRRLFEYAEKSKALTLLENFYENKARRIAGLPPSVLERELYLKRSIANLEKKRYAEKTKADPNGKKIDRYNSRIFDLKSSYDSLLQRLETSYPRYYKLKYDYTVTSVAEVQRMLSSNQTLVEYFVGQNSVFIFRIASDDHEVIEIKKDFPLDSLVQQMRQGLYGPYIDKEAIDVSYRNKTFAADRFADAAHQLYQKLIGPIEAKLDSNIIIIPDGSLGYIPFQALIKHQSDRSYRYKEHRYFGMEYRISYSYSATFLLEMIEKEHLSTDRKSVLAIAPYYDGTPYSVDPIRQVELEAMGIVDLVASRGSLEPLPHSGEECLTIQALWDGHVLKEEAATKERFIDMAGDYQILHLATHGKANDKIGEFAYLAFTEIEDEEENELLYIKDIYNLQLNADLVVLSACQTGIGELRRGEGIISLARAFAYAGAKSIVNTLWSVKDRQTKDIMIDFHINLKRGDDKSDALWKAQKKYLATHDGEKANPYYWAPFIAIGDMSPVERL